MDVAGGQQVIDVSGGTATGVATTEIQPKDANSSFVRGVNTIWAFMFVEVSPRWPPRFRREDIGGLGSAPAATPAQAPSGTPRN